MMWRFRDVDDVDYVTGRPPDRQTDRQSADGGLSALFDDRDRSPLVRLVGVPPPAVIAGQTPPTADQ